MSQTRAEIISDIKEHINENNEQEITGQVMQDVMVNMTNNLATCDELTNVSRAAGTALETAGTALETAGTALETAGTALEDINKNPIEPSSGENSIHQKNTSTKAASETSLAVGKNNFAGLKGFYYKHIQKVGAAGTTVNIFLSQTQVVPTMGSSSVTKDTTIQPSEFLEINDIITIINDSKYYNVLKINNFLSGGGGIQAKWIGAAAFTTIKETSPLNTDDYTCYCLEKPDAGIVDIGKGAVTIGEEIKATNLGAFATGYKNTSWGNFSFTEGRENEAGYIGHAEGHHTKASGVRAHAEGYYTISNGSSSHAEGQHTRAEGQASHIEGHSASDVSDETVAKNNDGIITDWNTTKFSLAKGVASHVEGKDNLGLGNESHAEGFQTIAGESYSHAEGRATIANGQASHSEGQETIANNDFEHAEGMWNISHTGLIDSEKTIHSIGIGSGAGSTAYQNAFEVMQNGLLFIIGVNGYDGTNPDKTRSIQAALESVGATIDWTKLGY